MSMSALRSASTPMGLPYTHVSPEKQPGDSISIMWDIENTSVDAGVAHLELFIEGAQVEISGDILINGGSIVKLNLSHLLPLTITEGVYNASVQMLGQLAGEPETIIDSHNFFLTISVSVGAILQSEGEPTYS